MSILCYIFGGACMICSLITGVCYQKDKVNEAFIFKMMASSLFLAMGIIALGVTPNDNIQGILVVLGMLMSFWGDYFLARREKSLIGATENFLSGVYIFGIAQIFLSMSLLVGSDFKFEYYFLPLLVTGLLPLIVGKLTHMLSFKRKEFASSLVYGLLLSVTLMIACSNFYIFNDTTSLLSMLGAISFLLSDCVLGLFYFSNLKQKKYLHYPIMLLYFLAEVLYGLSLLF